MLTEQLLQEIAAGQAEPLTRAARRIPPTRLDRPVTLGCLLRWINPGVRGPNGRRIQLEAARLAGKWVTTPGAIRRFVLAQTPNLAAEDPGTPRTPAQRRKATELAAKALNKIGI
jgi:hypothetical protein